jgi:hypothetical protein
MRAFAGNKTGCEIHQVKEHETRKLFGKRDAVANGKTHRHLRHEQGHDAYQKHAAYHVFKIFV